MATLCCCPTASLWWVITFPPADGLAAWKGSVSGHVWPCVCVCSLPACLCAWFMSADLRMSSVSLPHRRLLSQAAPLWVLDQDGHSGGTEPTRDSLELELIFTTHFMVEWKHCQGCQVFKNTMGFVALFPLLLQCTALKRYTTFCVPPTLNTDTLLTRSVPQPLERCMYWRSTWRSFKH